MQMSIPNTLVLSRAHPSYSTDVQGLQTRSARGSRNVFKTTVRLFYTTQQISVRHALFLLVFGHRLFLYSDTIL